MQNDRLENKPLGKQEEQDEEISAQELVRRHLEDKNHVITDEDMQKVKVGLPNDEEPAAGIESASYFEGEENKDEEKKDGENPVRPATPWDVVE